MRKHSIDTNQEFICEIIKKHLPDAKVFLFGSRARRTQSIGSDYDIALDHEEPIALGILAKIRDELEQSRFPFYVDIVDFATVSKSMREEIEKEKVLWNC